MHYITYASVYIHVSDCVLVKCYTSLHGNVHACMQNADYCRLFSIKTSPFNPFHWIKREAMPLSKVTSFVLEALIELWTTMRHK